MRLDWNDIRARAAKFAEEWKATHCERGGTQTFYNEFFELFGVTRSRAPEAAVILLTLGG